MKVLLIGQALGPDGDPLRPHLSGRVGKKFANPIRNAPKAKMALRLQSVREGAVQLRPRRSMLNSPMKS